MFGNPEVTTGGKALKFYATVRSGYPQGRRNKGRSRYNRQQNQGEKSSKNKVAPPPVPSRWKCITARGHAAPAVLLDAAVDVGLIEKSGTWFSYKGDRIGQGKDNARAYIEAHPSLWRSWIPSCTPCSMLKYKPCSRKAQAVKPLKAADAAGDSADELDQDD